MVSEREPVEGARRQSGSSDRLVGGEAVHRSLRQQILDGGIRSGSVLSQVELAGRFGVSRTPLREALKMLQEEGLVEAVGRRVRVANLDFGDLEAISAQRIMLSALSTYITVPKLTDHELFAMKGHLEAMKGSAGIGDADAWRRSDVAFHSVHCASAPSRLYQEVRRLAERNSFYQLVWLRHEPHRDAETVVEHNLIMDACENANAAEAAKSIARHQARIAITVLANAAPEHEPATIRSALQLVMGTAHQPARAVV